MHDMLRCGSLDSLDMYDDRMSSCGSFERSSLLDKSLRGAESFRTAAHLETVNEV